MLVSDSFSASGPLPSSMSEAQGLTTVGRLLFQLRRAGLILTFCSSLGLLVALLSVSILGVIFAMGGAAAGLWLLWAARHFAAALESGDTATMPLDGWSLEAVTLPLLQGITLVGNGAVRVCRGVVKLAAGIVTGVGIGLVTVGVFALQNPTRWEFEVMRHGGPPLAPLALGAGVAMLTALLTLVVLFRRSRMPGS